MQTEYGLCRFYKLKKGTTNRRTSYMSLSLYGSTALWTLATFQFLHLLHSR
jgi:hypothetical protein